MSTATYDQTKKKRKKKIIRKFFSYMDLCNQVSKSHVLDNLGQNDDAILFCNLVREPFRVEIVRRAVFVCIQMAAMAKIEKKPFKRRLN